MHHGQGQGRTERVHVQHVVQRVGRKSLNYDGLRRVFEAADAITIEGVR